MSSNPFSFSLALPYANLFWCAVLSAIIGVILASAFSAIFVYAQLVPGKVGAMSGLFFGLGGLGSALLGTMAATAFRSSSKFAPICPLSASSPPCFQI